MIAARIAFVVAVSCAALFVRVAEGQPLDCDEAYAEHQKLRVEGRLVEARAATAQCLLDTCDPDVRQRCEAHRQEIDAEIPTVVFVLAAPNGAVATTARLTLDGKALGVIGSSPIPVDPGAHEALLELDGAQPIDEKFEIGKGAKAVTIGRAFQPLEPLLPRAEEGAPKPNPPGPATDVRGAGIPAPAWIAGGLGLAFTGVAVGFAADASFALGKEAGACDEDLRNCTLPPSSVDALNERKDVGLGMAIGAGALAAAGLTTAVVVIVTHSRETAPHARGGAPVVTAAARLQAGGTGFRMTLAF